MVKNEIKLTSQNNQPIKTIIHQDVYAAKETLEKLQSWVSTLELFETFFDERDRDLLNKKRNYPTISFDI